MFNPVSNQFHITYKKREVPILIPIERQLCKEMGLTRSDLHKNAIKRLWNSRQEKQLKFVWENNEASKSKSCEISNAYWTRKGQQKKYWELFGRPDWFDLCKEKVIWYLPLCFPVALFISCFGRTHFLCTESQKGKMFR